MFTILLTLFSFLGGVYVGARWAEKIKAVYYFVINK